MEEKVTKGNTRSIPRQPTAHPRRHSTNDAQSYNPDGKNGNGGNTANAPDRNIPMSPRSMEGAVSPSKGGLYMIKESKIPIPGGKQNRRDSNQSRLSLQSLDIPIAGEGSGEQSNQSSRAPSETRDPSETPRTIRRISVNSEYAGQSGNSVNSSRAPSETSHPGSRLATETPGRDASESVNGGGTTRSKLKIKQMHCAWSTTTLSSAADTSTSDGDLDDHINVVLRVRPLNSQEQTRGDNFSCTFHGGGRLEVNHFNQLKQFGYNVTFEPEATQADVFEHSGVKKLIDMALNGYACTALAFGQTGSGKTHTMTGPPQQFEGGKHPDPEMVGIMQRSFAYLFQQSSLVGGNKIIRASYLEIYNEQVIDLLNPNQRRYLQVRWSKNKGFYVENLFVAECESVDDLNAVLEEGGSDPRPVHGGQGRPVKNLQIDVEITPRGRIPNYHPNDNRSQPVPDTRDGPIRRGSRDSGYSNQNMRTPNNYPQNNRGRYQSNDYSNENYARHNFSAEARNTERQGDRGNVSVLSSKSFPYDNRNAPQSSQFNQRYSARGMRSEHSNVQYVMRSKSRTPGNSRSSTMINNGDDISSQDAIAREYADALNRPTGGTGNLFAPNAYQSGSGKPGRFVDHEKRAFYEDNYQFQNRSGVLENNPVRKQTNERYSGGRVRNSVNESNSRIPVPNKSGSNSGTPKHRPNPTVNSQNRMQNGQKTRKSANHSRGYDFPHSEDEDDKIDLDSTESEYSGEDLYLCYLMADNGAVVGPMRLDINDVQLGLPSQVETKDKKSGMRNRQMGSHGLNEFSSRSHSMLTLTVDSEQQDPDDDTLYLTKRGKLTFVDLAGSEKVKDSESSETSLKESNNINRSLLVLGNCISSLGDAKKRQGHIPYRDSKLTKLLADSLGGNGVTLMIACVTPSSHHVSETMNTLRYASRAKRIKTKPIVKMDPREKLILSLKREIKILRNENVYLRQQLEFPSKPKENSQKENDEKMKKLLKAQEKEPKSIPANNKGSTEAGLYEMLQEYMIENEALRSENSDLHSTKDRIKREQQLMYRENERLMKRLDDIERNQANWQRQFNGMQYPDQNYFENMPRQPPNRPPYQGPPGPPGPPGHPGPPGPPGPMHQNSQHQQWKSPRHPAEQYPVPSPQNNSRGSQSKPPRAGPKRPPHRLPDPIMRPAPDHVQNGVYHDDGYMSPRGRPPLQNGPARQPESPIKGGQDRRSATSNTTTDSIMNMNEKLKQEILELEGEIEHHHMVNQRTKSIYGSQTSVRSGYR